MLIIGLIIGGIFGVIIMALLQINRSNKLYQEIYRLRRKVDILNVTKDT